MVIRESRVLPGLIGFSMLAMSLVIICFPVNSVGLTVALAGAAFAASVCFIYLFVCPRWILRVESGRLLVNDIISKRRPIIPLEQIKSVRVTNTCTMGVGADGGIGFQNELILELPASTLAIQLPLLDVPAKRLVPLIQAELSRNSS